MVEVKTMLIWNVNKQQWFCTWFYAVEKSESIRGSQGGDVQIADRRNRIR